MYLSIQRRKNGKTYLSICRQYIDPLTKKRRSKTVKSLGSLDKLNEEFDDPIKHFQEVVKEMNSNQSIIVHFISLTDISRAKHTSLAAGKLH